MRKFKAYCVEHDIKQSEISEIIGVGLQNVNKKLNGKQKFTLEQVEKLCRHFGISADDYFID